MKNWLQKILAPLAPPPGAPKRPSSQLPTKTRPGSVPGQPLKYATPPPTANLPNATVIYGIGAAFLFVASLFILISGRWFSALIVFILGLCLMGFAVHLMKHQD